jgi:hypothetical protein
MMGRTRESLVRSLSMVLLLALAAGSAGADALVYEEGGEPLFTIEIPDDWQVDLDFADEAREAGAAEGEEPEFRIVEIWPRDESHVWLGVWSLPDVSTLDEGLAYLSTLRGDLFSDVEISEPKAGEVHGMPTRTMKGSAKRDGDDVRFAMALFSPREGAVVAVLYAGEPQAWEANREALAGMVSSFQAAE